MKFVTTMWNSQGQRVTLRTRSGDQNSTQALNAVRVEQERLKEWQKLEDPERHMVQAVVRSTLRRLLDDPGWIPSSVRLGRDRLDVFFVVELDSDQVDAARAAVELDLEIALARERQDEMEEMLTDDEDDGTAP